MTTLVIGALVAGMVAVVILVVGAYNAGRVTGTETARQIFADIVESTRRELDRERAAAIAERERAEDLATDLAAERADRKRADDERRVFASESFNAKLDLQRLRRQFELKTSELADQWAQLQVLRDQLDSVTLASATTLGDTCVEPATRTQRSPRGIGT